MSTEIKGYKFSVSEEGGEIVGEFKGSPLGVAYMIHTLMEEDSRIADAVKMAAMVYQKRKDQD